jgi:hypothetical protein
VAIPLLIACSSPQCRVEYSSRIIHVEIPTAWAADTSQMFEICADRSCYAAEPTVTNSEASLDVTAQDSTWNSGDVVQLSLTTTSGGGRTRTAQVTAHPIASCTIAPIVSARFDEQTDSLVETSYTDDLS